MCMIYSGDVYESESSNGLGYLLAIMLCSFIFVFLNIIVHALIFINHYGTFKKNSIKIKELIIQKDRFNFIRLLGYLIIVYLLHDYTIANTISSTWNFIFHISSIILICFYIIWLVSSLKINVKNDMTL